MVCWKSLVLVFTLCGLGRAAAVAAEAPDLSKIERRIKKEPHYQSKEPLYGLYVFGPEAKTHIWAVLDKSVDDADQYDVLYFDRDADGDLTEPGERIDGTVQQVSVTFDIGDLKDPHSDDVHTGLSLSRRARDDRSVFLQMQWQGKEPVMGGYAPQSGPYAKFAASAAKAPILWFDASGWFSFQTWGWNREVAIGSSADMRVFLGHRGVGDNTFCAVSQTFLPDHMPVLAKLIYTDTEGQERSAAAEFHERC
ncbi:MAG TPA: hypothetical protein VGX76_06235 [Pirellulales bacterium]|jgi:hypothetical protein|nr:hypothetical protein [Pirellulales bacterium]